LAETHFDNPGPQPPLSRVGGQFGKQLGRIEDALAVLIDYLPKDLKKHEQPSYRRAKRPARRRRQGQGEAQAGGFGLIR